MKLAPHTDVLRDWSRVPALRGARTRNEPLRMSAWEATVKQAYVDGVLIVGYANERKSARRMGRKHLATCPHVSACFRRFFSLSPNKLPTTQAALQCSNTFYYEDLC